MIFAAFLLILSACQDGPETGGAVTATLGNTPTPTPVPNPLTVCLGEAPNTLYPYGNPNEAAQEVLQAVYDGPVDHRGYQYQPVILESVPDMANGTAILQTVQVFPGDMVVDNNGEVTSLDFGTFIRPAGCFSSDCAVSFDGSPITMAQMVALFNLRPGVNWADGTPLTARDSVFGFEMNASPDSPGSKYKVERTRSYEALNDTLIQWTGIPGFIDQSYMDNFWTPAPRHLWEGTTPIGLQTAEMSAKKPMGYGAFSILSWDDNEITLVENPAYFRAAERSSTINLLVFKVVGTDAPSNLNLLLSGECDVLDKSAAKGLDPAYLLGLQDEGQLALGTANGNAWELINFGIQHQTYDNGYSMWQGDRANFFGDVRTRQAIAMCIDREKISQEITGGLAPVMDTYVPPGHYLVNPDAASYGYDPSGAAALLEEVGWVMSGDGYRYSSGILEVFDGRKFSINYAYLDHPQSEAIANIVKEGLEGCGIEATLSAYPKEELFATGAEALVFGRQFDLAQFSWQMVEEPSCYLYLSNAIPGDDLDTFPYTWGGWNLTGWEDLEFDAACLTTQGAAPGLEPYTLNHYEAQKIFADALPVIPLFTYQNIALARPDICGFEFDPTAGFLWNIENLGYGELCK